MRDLIQTMWLRLFMFAAGRLGFRYIFPYAEDMVVHVAVSEAALLASMRDYIDDHEAEAKQRKDEALNLNH